MVNNSSELSRRNLLKYLGAGVGTSALTILPTLVNTSEAQGQSFLEVLANYLSARVPRQDVGGHKWGWNVEIHRTNPNDYYVIMKNEKWTEGNDPSRALTTVFWVGDPRMGISNDYELKWFRVDELSHLVANPNDVNAMDVYVKVDPSVHVNNLTGDGAVPVSYKNGWLNHVNQFLHGSGGLLSDHERLFRYLVSEADPHSVSTIGAVRQNSNGTFVYDINLYKVDVQSDRRELVLSTTMDMNNGQQAIWRRNNYRPGPFSKLSLQNRGHSVEGGYQEAGLANVPEDWARESRVWLPHFPVR